MQRIGADRIFVFFAVFCFKTIDRRYRGFFWQRGYGALSVSPTQLGAVIKYVDEQEEHHRTRTFQEEYLALLRKHGIEFDEQYVWD